MLEVYLLFIVLVIAGTIEANDLISEKLQFVNVIFCHGERAPDRAELYPYERYSKEDFYPMGYGGLTNLGKIRSFRLGQNLRGLYGDFLGDEYIYDDIVARSTNYPRTKMSLALVLASLYPPAGSQRWNHQLNWQPIPISYRPAPFDQLLQPQRFPKYTEELDRVLESREVKNQVKEFDELMQNLTYHTGKPITTINDVFHLYQNLMSKISIDFELPEWAKPLLENHLRNATILEYKLQSYNDMLKKFNGGPLLKCFLDNMLAVKNDGKRSAWKMNLFSAHDTNIAALLNTLGVLEPHVPEYSSAIFFELILQNGRYYVKILYYRGHRPMLETLTIPGCRRLCLLSRVSRLLEKVIPTDFDLERR